MLRPIANTCPGCSGSLGYQGLVRLLGYEHDARVSRVLGIDVAKVHIHELMLAMILSCSFTRRLPSMAYSRIMRASSLSMFSSWKDKLHESAEGPANAYRRVC